MLARFFTFTFFDYLKSLKISLPLAKSSNAISSINPVTCAYSKNLSPGFLPVIISHRVKTTCPPSSAGIGNKFINPNMIDKNAVIFQNVSALHSEGKILPIEMKPPKPL